MESHNAKVETRARGSSRTHSISRWSPAREQIRILENLYKQGIKTPNAEQIHQITTRLRVYGHIEGKNVFYWFQNHKARQRQKQKQKQPNFAYVNHSLHTSQPIGSSPNCQSVVHAPSCLQQSGLISHSQQPMVLANGGISSRNEKDVSFGMPRMCDFSIRNRQTLTLFPLHPTGILEGKTTIKVPSHTSISVGITDKSSYSPDIDKVGHSQN